VTSDAKPLIIYSDLASSKEGASAG
jgi:hypothetical protein